MQLLDYTLPRCAPTDLTQNFDYPAKAKFIFVDLCKGLDLNERLGVHDWNVPLRGYFCAVFLFQRHYKVCKCAINIACTTSCS